MEDGVNDLNDSTFFEASNHDIMISAEVCALQICSITHTLFTVTFYS